MEIETLRSFLAWCTVINWVLLLLWWGMYCFGRDWIYGLHRKWFDLSKETFAAIHYSGIAVFKILIIVFNLAPYLALRFFF